MFECLKGSVCVFKTTFWRGSTIKSLKKYSLMFSFIAFIRLRRNYRGYEFMLSALGEDTRLVSPSRKLMRGCVVPLFLSSLRDDSLFWSKASLFYMFLVCIFNLASGDTSPFASVPWSRTTIRCLPGGTYAAKTNTFYLNFSLSTATDASDPSESSALMSEAYNSKF